jgi:hypothetical protein
MDRCSEACALMLRFAERTGLSLNVPGQRYLWTDAFAVCNFLGLAELTGVAAHEELALRLIERVHGELGRFHEEDRRRGWLSGLSDSDARIHPTRGGLRIGKPLPERAVSEAFDPELEWERDGQYFHYLTKWMHALDQAARFTGECTYNTWACELMQAAHRAFVYGPPGHHRMVWKVSVDLTRPLVPSMGQHDPIDGWATCRELATTAAAFHAERDPALATFTTDFGRMILREALSTDDPLGLGGLFFDTYRLAKIEPTSKFLPWLVEGGRRGLEAYLSEHTLLAPAHHRLAFRELGLALGLAAMASLDPTELRAKLDPRTYGRYVELAEHEALRQEIVSFWLRPEHRRVSTWTEHLDISDVMLATCLVPEGFLLFDPRRSTALPANGGPSIARADPAWSNSESSIAPAQRR